MIPAILSRSGLSVTDEPIKANATPAKPSFFYRVSDGKHAATVFGEYDAEKVVTIVIPRFSLRFGRRKFTAAIRSSLLSAGFADYPNPPEA